MLTIVVFGLMIRMSSCPNFLELFYMGILNISWVTLLRYWFCRPYSSFNSHATGSSSGFCNTFCLRCFCGLLDRQIPLILVHLYGCILSVFS